MMLYAFHDPFPQPTKMWRSWRDVIEFSVLFDKMILDFILESFKRFSCFLDRVQKPRGTFIVQAENAAGYVLLDIFTHSGKPVIFAESMERLFGGKVT